LFDDVVMTHTKSNVIQYNEYYPFGMNTANSWTRENTTGNNFLYNAGSELNKTTSNYEMFFREYDPALGRMTSVDPVAGKYSSLTPYNYAFNTPVNLNDPSGADPYGRSTLRDWAANNRLDGGRIYQDADGGMYGSGVFGSAFIRYGPGDGGALTDLVDFMAAGALQARLRRGLEVTIDWARVEDGVHVLNFSSGQYLRIPTQQILDNVSLYKSVFGVTSWVTTTRPRLWGNSDGTGFWYPGAVQSNSFTGGIVKRAIGNWFKDVWDNLHWNWSTEGNFTIANPLKNEWNFEGELKNGAGFVFRKDARIVGEVSVGNNQIGRGKWYTNSTKLIDERGVYWGGGLSYQYTREIQSGIMVDQNRQFNVGGFGFGFQINWSDNGLKDWRLGFDSGVGLALGGGGKFGAQMGIIYVPK
jgi:RHS repeat-associated protein